MIYFKLLHLNPIKFDLTFSLSNEGYARSKQLLQTANARQLKRAKTGGIVNGRLAGGFFH